MTSGSWRIAVSSEGIDARRRKAIIRIECSVSHPVTTISTTVLASNHRLGTRQPWLGLHRLGKLLGRLHDRGVYHDDLKATHILLESGRVPENGDLDGVVLIDLHNAQTGREPSVKQRGTNLAQVIRSLPLPRCSDQFRLLFGMVGSGPEKRDARRRLHRAALAALAKRQG